MKKPALFASFIAVFFLAFFLSRKMKEGSSYEHRTERVPPSESDRKAGERNEGAANDRGNFRDLVTDEYQKAWDAIPGRKLKKGDRLKLQREVLKEWAKRDLKAAAKAAFAEAWDDQYDTADRSLEQFLAKRTSEEFSRDEILELVEQGGAIGKMAVAPLVQKASTGPATAESLTVAETLPEEVRSEYVYALMRGESSDPEFAKRGIDLLIEAGEWQMLSNKEVSEKVRLIAAETPPADLAAWAVALPQREEAARLFHRGVEPYIQTHPDEAWDWIGQFDEGMWRDRAYAEFSQQSLNHFNDPARSKEALDRISDPAFQREAWSWRRGWENRTGFQR